jgi:triacylglycerol lipase
MLGVKYWGGFECDYEEELRKKGFQVFTACVGPFSSNWDRACELYAQIKGGTVFYGTNHSKKYGHDITGRTVSIL